MRKVISGVLAALTVLSISTATVFAAGPGNGRYFTDADNDGVFDNAVCIYEDTDGDGICDVCGTNHGNCLGGQGAAFVDADGDGICDNYVSGQCQDSGCGHGQGSRGGHGHGFRGGHCR